MTKSQRGSLPRGFSLSASCTGRSQTYFRAGKQMWHSLFCVLVTEVRCIKGEQLSPVFPSHVWSCLGRCKHLGLFLPHSTFFKTFDPFEAQKTASFFSYQDQAAHLAQYLMAVVANEPQELAVESLRLKLCHFLLVCVCVCVCVCGVCVRCVMIEYLHPPNLYR